MLFQLLTYSAFNATLWHSEQSQCGINSNLLLAHFSGTFFDLPKRKIEAEKEPRLSNKCWDKSICAFTLPYSCALSHRLPYIQPHSLKVVLENKEGKYGRQQKTARKN